MQISDDELIQRTVRRADQHAYGQLVQRYQSPLRYTLRRWCDGDLALADDLAQETFIKVYRALPSFRREAKFSTWLYRIAHNVFISHRRKAKVEIDLAVVGDDMDDCIDNVDIQYDVGAAIAQLSKGEQMAIHLCLQRGFSHQEAASILHIPLGSVKTHVLRGKQKLQKLLAPWQEEVTHD